MKGIYKAIIVLIAIVIIFASSLLISYSSYENITTKTYDETIVETDEFLSINYFDGKSFDIKYMQRGETIVKNVSVTNESETSTYLTISLMDINKKSDKINIKVVDQDDKEVFNQYIGNMDTEIIKTVPINSKETLKYTIYISNDSLEDDNYGISCNLVIYKELVAKNVVTIYDEILKNNEISELKTNIGEESTENEGLIKAIDDDGETYYFRGNVENNYFKLGNETFRITRINGDGSVRMILNYTTGDDVNYKKDIDNENYISNVLYSTSDVKKYLDTWLSDNINDYKDYIIDSVFCSDSSYSQETTRINYFSSYSRVITDNSPSLKCLGTPERHKIGLLSVDEVIYAGGSTSKNNEDYYLYTSAISNSWWTSSGSQVIKNNNVVDNFTVNNQGGINYQNKISSSLGVRPVISIDKNTTVKGTGKLNDPYEIN